MRVSVRTWRSRRRSALTRRAAQAPGFGAGVTLGQDTLDGQLYYGVAEIEVFSVA